MEVRAALPRDGGVGGEQGLVALVLLGRGLLPPLVAVDCVSVELGDVGGKVLSMVK